MEKVKKYNHFLLAIIGTIGLLFFLGSGAIAISEYFKYNNYEEIEYRPGLLAETKTDSLIKEEKREQILTFNEFVEIDTLKKLYVIPVGQRNLNESESTGEVLGLINSFSGKKVKGYRNKYGLNYNNLILYESATYRTRVIFDTRSSISNFYSFENGNFLMIRCATEDTNKDGYIDNYDLQEMYLYNTNELVLDKIEKPKNISFMNFAKGIENSELVFQFGIDRNDNGEFNNNEEPKVHYKLNLKTKSLILLLPESQINQIQKLLEGRTN